MSIEPQHPNGELPASSAETRANARRSSTAQISSIVALAVSVLALATGAYQTRLMQVQARASVWPSVAIGASYFGSGDNAGFTWFIDNNGVGPARIQTVSVSFDGKPKRNWSEVFVALSMDPNEKENTVIYNIGGKVLPPNVNRETAIQAIKVVKPEVAKRFFEAMDRFAISICYCSVYDECWLAHWPKRVVDPVAQCTVRNSVEFEQ